MTPPPPPKPSVLPVSPKAFHEFYRAPAFRWWKPLVAVVTVALAWVVLSIVLVLPFLFADLSTGALTFDELASGKMPATPLFFLANNLTIIAFIPLAILAHRIVFRQPVGYLCSIEGRLRWRLLGRFLLAVLPVFVVMLLVGFVVDGWPVLTWDAHSLPMILIVLLTTPLQCAGEEFAMRGLLPRAVGSYFGNRAVGWVAATVVSSIVFMFLHGAGDPWLNVFYLSFAVVSSVLVWRTGGLEASIAMHVVNNMIGLLFLPFQDMSGLFDREAGVGSPADLIQVVFLLAAAAMVWWQARRVKLMSESTPGVPPRRAMAGGVA